MHHTQHGVFALSGTGMIAATLLMLMLCIINIASFRGLVSFNFILFSFKILVIFLTISLLINHRFNTSNFVGATTFSGMASWGAILSAVASGGIAFAFTGFKHGVELAGEAKQPHIAIPLGIIGSVVVCLLIYLGLQIAFIGALDPKMIANGWAHLSFTGDTGPFVGLALLLGLTILAKLLYIDAAVSPMGAGLIYVTSTARIIYAMSKNGYLPKFLSGLNRKHFPIWAIFFNFLVGMFLFLPLPGWQNMVSFLVSAVVISYAMGPVSLLALRRQLPLEHRSFRLPFANFFSYIAFFSCNLLSYWTGWATVSKLAIAMIIGAIFLLLALRKGRVTAQSLGLRAMVWMAPYLGGLVLISYLGSFGGIHVIPFGWDFLVIAIFSAVILTMSVKARSEETEAQFAVYKASNFVTG
jgi:amino acid transporter